jgi:hypothetical protein
MDNRKAPIVQNRNVNFIPRRKPPSAAGGIGTSGGTARPLLLAGQMVNQFRHLRAQPRGRFCAPFSSAIVVTCPSHYVKVVFSYNTGVLSFAQADEGSHYARRTRLTVRREIGCSELSDGRACSSMEADSHQPQAASPSLTRADHVQL